MAKAVIKYRQTDIGIIPLDWDIKCLGDLAEIKDGTHQTPRYVDNGISFYSVENVTASNFTNTKYISKEEHSFLTKSYKIEKGDILMTRIGSIGDCKFIDWDVDASFYVSLALLKVHKDYNAQYICHYSKTTAFKKEISINSLQHAVPQKINLGNIGFIKIALPCNKAEQTAIATALCDTDALVTSLEKLLTKKRSIKQGAIQKLLAPKRGWMAKRLGEVVEVVSGGTPSTSVPNYWNGTINWFTPTEIGHNKYTFESVRKITKEGLSNCSARILPVGTILLTSRAGIGDLSILMKEGCTNQGFQSLIAKAGYSNDYLYYLMLTQKNVLIQNASGSTFLEISPGKIKQIEISIPDIKTQSHIASILNEMDNEIDVLVMKLEKIKILKQGMMQQLLTGKIRLI